MRETTPNMIYQPNPEWDEKFHEIRRFFSILSYRKFDQAILDEINTQLQEGGVKAAAHVLLDEFGSEIHEMSNPLQSKQA